MELNTACLKNTTVFSKQQYTSQVDVSKNKTKEIKINNWLQSKKSWVQLSSFVF